MYGPMAATLMCRQPFVGGHEHVVRHEISHAVLITGYQDDPSVPGRRVLHRQESVGAPRGANRDPDTRRYYAVPYS